jgi:peptide/nickel transport system ATP-binding protein
VDHTQAILEVQNLHIAFGSFTAVNNLSFSIGKGETLAIVGESGSGKSLTALALMGLLPKEATISGVLDFYVNTTHYPLHNLPVKQWLQLRGKETTMIFQEPMSALNPVMKIGKQLTEVITAHNNLTSKESKNKSIEWLYKVQLPEPEKIYERYPHQLSGGQKQRVMIAMAMCNNPPLLIADEPTTALDATVQQEIITLMQTLQQQQGSAMIFITHDLALAAQVADKVLVMYKGEVMEYGTVQQVLQSPVHTYTKALVACRPSPSHKGYRLPVVEDFLNADKSKTDINIADQPQQNVTKTNENILQVKELRVWFSTEKNWMGKTTQQFKAVDDVSFELKKGEVLGLVGESGCGKSTLSRSLLGLLPVQDGQIIYNGKDLARLPASGWKGIRRQIQMIFQDPFASLNPRMTVGDMLTEPMRVHDIVPSADLKKEAARLLSMVQLPATALTRYPHQFSGGQRQRLGIARALAVRPQLIVCDESVSALDVSVQAQILNLLKDLQKEFNLSYLFISHDLSVVHYISDRVMVMQAGRIVETGEAEQVLYHPADDYTQKLVAAMPLLS